MVSLSVRTASLLAISTGIANIDLSTGAATRLPQPDTVVTAGCDGLYWYRGDLVGIQNVTNPGRVIRIALTDQGTRISGITVLQSYHHPDSFSLRRCDCGRGVIRHRQLICRSLQPYGSLKDPGQTKAHCDYRCPTKTTTVVLMAPVPLITTYLEMRSRDQLRSKRADATISSS